MVPGMLELLSEVLNTFDFIFIMLGIVALAGIFGFAFDKKILNKRFWTIFLPVLIIFNFFYYLFVSIILPEIFPIDKGIKMSILSLFNIFYYLPLAFYILRRDKIWNGQEYSNYSLWKLLFFILVFYVYTPNFLLIFTSPAELNWYEKLDIIWGLLLLIGVYGFAWKKPLFQDILWKSFCIVYAVWYIVFWFLPHSQPYRIMLDFVNNPILIIIGVLLSLLYFSALYLYAFKSKDVWEQKA